MPLRVKTGIDLIEKHWPRQLRRAGIGLLVHPASVAADLRHSADICSSMSRFRLRALFGPQHGIRGETQDNMIEWSGFRDRKTGLPVYSLYGKTRKPHPDMLADIDAMIIDLQDVGARYYTFIWTMALVMEACEELGRAVVVLDRPNPITGLYTEGPVLDPNFSSFVGLRRLMVRHGMTIGEIAGYLRDTYYPRLDLYILPMEGWKRRMWFDDTGLPWVLPSPNMPTIETALVYPGMCLLEGTNLSEGRGTTRPFEIIGAPFIDPEKLGSHLAAFRLPGAHFRPLHFIPTFQKYAGKLCGGVQIHIADRNMFRPFLTAAAVLKAVRELYPNKLRWSSPPYEYEKTLLPIDILTGSGRFREDIDEGRDLKEMKAWWQQESAAFNRSVRRHFLIY